MDEMDPELAQRQLRALNAQRQKELVKDTAKLLILAKALNAQTQDENAATLTESQWKEIDRIAKLAHSVKEKMVQTYGGRQIFEPQMGPPIR
jgi:endonuclease III